jgi:hypothetical protein
VAFFEFYSDSGFFSHPFLLDFELSGEVLDDLLGCSFFPLEVLLLIVKDVKILPFSVFQGDQVIGKETILSGRTFTTQGRLDTYS